MIRIGFLLNHDAAHQVMHCIPTAFELARRNPEVSVVIISTTEEEAEAVAGIAKDYPDATTALENWLESPNHRKTIEGEFTHTAVSVKKDSSGKFYFTQLFYR